MFSNCLMRLTIHVPLGLSKVDISSSVDMSASPFARRAHRPVLPGYLLQAVQCGEVKKVRNWLLRGGSVDA